MREYSIVSSLLELAEREVAAQPGAKVVRLLVRIGELAPVDVDLLRSVFDVCREHSVCAGAVLEIAPAPAVWRCPRCERAVAQGTALQCASCYRPAELVAGGEIILERIELEVASCEDCRCGDATIACRQAS